MANGKYYKAWDGWPYCEACALKIMAQGFRFPDPIIGTTDDKCTDCRQPVVVEQLQQAEA